MPTTPLADGLVLRPVTEDEWRAFIVAGEFTFHGDIHDDDLPVWREAYPLPHSLAVFDGDDIVATTTAYPFSLTVPTQRQVAAAGVTAVSVLPTHRRRGLLTALMRRQLDDYRDAGIPLAILTASESAIYGRFGYGLASWSLRLAVPRAASVLRATVPMSGGRIRLTPPSDEDSRQAMAAIDEDQRLTRPGRYARDAQWFVRATYDTERWREGAAAKQLAIHERPDGTVDGYALYAVKPSWHDGVPTSELRVQLLDATNDAARAALWRYLFGIDLVATFHSPSLALDDPLLAMLVDHRRAAPRLLDDLYVRLVDVGAALAGRTYRRPVDVVLEVADAFCPWNAGRWRLRGDDSGATCEHTGEQPDLGVDVVDLGAAYLGGRPLSTLAAGGTIVEHTKGALIALTDAMTSPIAPWSPEIF